MKGDTTRGLDEDPPEPALPLFGKKAGEATVGELVSAVKDGLAPNSYTFEARCPDCLVRASTPVTPLSDVLFVRPDPLPGVSAWGIVLPDDPRVNKAVWHGVVIAAGPGFLEANGRRREPQVRVGDRVVFPRYSAHEVKGVPGHGTVWSVLEREVLATCGVDVVLTDAVVKSLPQGR